MALPKTSNSTFQPQKPEELFDKIYEKLPSDVKTSHPRQTTPYQIVYQNWYKTIPYALRIDKGQKLSSSKKGNLNVLDKISSNKDDAPLMYFFPINPESVSINTPYAVNVTPTLGGIVEEHSGAVFYNITITGTTGVLPELNYTTGVPVPPNKLRPEAAEDGLIPAGALGGFGSSLISSVNSIVSTFTGTSSKMVDGKRNTKSGYTAYHVLYKYIWLYHFTKANGVAHNLKFINFKDNNQYNVAVQNFQLTRDKSRPHLYQYSIVMRAWNLQTMDGVASFGNPEARLKELGLDTGPSLKAKMKRVIEDTKSILTTAQGIMNAAAQDAAF